MRSNYLWYQFFRHGVIHPALKLFYSDISVSGREHIPEDKPVLFIGNHQNSFLDALHVVCNTRHFVHFLTRAEAFGNPVLDRFFYSLNMLPVYRARDGFGTIRRNDQIFEKCFHRLQQKDAVLVFAEASHAMVRRVRPLSKGFTRIVFGAEERYEWGLDLQIVPVGISYGDHCKSKTPVHISFGKAIGAQSYRHAFETDKRAASQTLTADVADRLKELTLHVPTQKDYPLYHLLLDELETDRSVLINPKKINSRARDIKEQVNGELTQEAEHLLEKAETYDVSIQELVNPPTPEFKDLMLAPCYGFSLINNALPYQLVRWLVNSYLEDEAFESSVKFLVGLLLPFYYLLLSTLLIAGGLHWTWGLGYWLVSMITMPFFVRGKDLLGTLLWRRSKRKELLKKKKFSDQLDKFKEIRKSLLKLIGRK